MIINGKQIAHLIREEIKQSLLGISSRKPTVAFLLVGDHIASKTYVKAKQNACKEIGIHSLLIQKPSSISEKELIQEIEILNRTKDVDGILVQLPLPQQIQNHAVMLSIDPAKDVDGFHPINMGKILLGDDSGFSPCTPLGICTLLEKSQISVSGQRVLILGRSNIVGKPLAAMLMQKKPNRNATVTIAHSQSLNLRDMIQSADILISAMGAPHFVTKEMVRPGSVVIDVGIHKLPNGTLIGDVDFVNVAPIASFITPVPGGIGPMTIAMLLQNTLQSYQRRNLC